MPWSECPVVNNTVVYECEVSSETAYFWYRTTLDVAPNIEDHGGLKWWIVLCLILSWITVFFIVMKGIQSSGKVSWSIGFNKSLIMATKSLMVERLIITFQKRLLC